MRNADEFSADGGESGGLQQRGGRRRLHQLNTTITAQSGAIRFKLDADDLTVAGKLLGNGTVQSMVALDAQK